MKKEEDFVMGLSIYMACLREKKRYSTAKSYQDALNSFKCFCVGYALGSFHLLHDGV